LWFVAILVLFLDIQGFGTLIWISFVPLVVSANYIYFLTSCANE
jgi:hypothetical protein